MTRYAPLDRVSALVDALDIDRAVADPTMFLQHFLDDSGTTTTETLYPQLELSSLHAASSQ